MQPNNEGTSSGSRPASSQLLKYSWFSLVLIIITKTFGEDCNLHSAAQNL